MKLFSFLLSLVVFFISAYFFTLKLPDIACFDDIIYVALLFILMAICITGILINWEIFGTTVNRKILLFISKKNKK